MAESEWTVSTALRRAAVHLLLWSVVCLAVWTMLAWSITPVLDAIPGTARGSARARFVVSLIVVLPMAWLCMRQLYDQLTEVAGFNSLLLTVAACACVWGVAIGGLLIAQHIRKPVAGNGAMALALGLAATVWIVYETYADR
jgi:hypothetical protein